MRQANRVVIGIILLGLIVGALLVFSRSTDGLFGTAGDATPTKPGPQEGVGGPPPTVTICHVAENGQRVTLNLPEPAVFGPGGHFNADRSPAGGHGQDTIGDCPPPTNTSVPPTNTAVAIANTATFTSVPPSDTPAPTTVEPSAIPSDTSIPASDTPTDQPSTDTPTDAPPSATDTATLEPDTPTNTVTDTRTPTATSRSDVTGDTDTPTVTDTDTPTATATELPTDTDTPTLTDTASPTDTDTPTETPSDTPTGTLPTDTPTATATELPTDTDTPTVTDTASPTDTDTPTETLSDTPTGTLPTDTPTATDTDTPTATNTETPSDTPTGTLPTDTPTETPSETPTGTLPTDTPTDSGTATETLTGTPPTDTETPTQVPAIFLSGRCEASGQTVEAIFDIQNYSDISIDETMDVLVNGILDQRYQYQADPYAYLVFRYSGLAGQSITLDIGTTTSLATETVLLDCSSTVGGTDTVTPTSPQPASISITTGCHASSISSDLVEGSFIITNNGGDMTSDTTYRLYEDDVEMLMADDLILQSGESAIVTYSTAPGAFLMLEVDQWWSSQNSLVFATITLDCLSSVTPTVPPPTTTDVVISGTCVDDPQMGAMAVYNFENLSDTPVTVPFEIYINDVFAYDDSRDLESLGMVTFAVDGEAGDLIELVADGHSYTVYLGCGAPPQSSLAVRGSCQAGPSGVSANYTVSSHEESIPSVPYNILQNGVSVLESSVSLDSSTGTGSFSFVGQPGDVIIAEVLDSFSMTAIRRRVILDCVPPTSAPPSMTPEAASATPTVPPGSTARISTLTPTPTIEMTMTPTASSTLTATPFRLERVPNRLTTGSTCTTDGSPRFFLTNPSDETINQDYRIVTARREVFLEDTIQLGPNETMEIVLEDVYGAFFLLMGNTPVAYTACYEPPEISVEAECRGSTASFLITSESSDLPGDTKYPDYEIVDEDGNVLRRGTLNFDNDEDMRVNLRTDGLLSFVSRNETLASVSCQTNTELYVEGICQGSNASFIITNLGEAIPETAPQAYQILDAGGSLIAEGTFVLDAGETTTVDAPACNNVRFRFVTNPS